MNTRWNTRERLGLLAGLLLISAATVWSENGRDFAGFYQLTNVVQAGDSYQFTFTARVFNYSGADVSNASLNLNDSNDPTATYATFTNVSIAANNSAAVTASVTVPSREYNLWQQGGSPNLAITFSDANAQDHLERVELSPGTVN